MTKVVFLDFETTGLNKTFDDEVLEVGIVDENGTELMNSFVKPVRKKSWPGAQRVHRISFADVAKAPTFDALEPSIIKLIKGNHVAIYNARYDVGFMTDAMKMSTASFICVMELFKKIVPRQRWRLQDAMAWSRYTVVQTHRAVDDAHATLHVWNALEARVKHRFKNFVRASTY